MQRLTYAMMKAVVAKKQAGDAQTYILDVRGTDEVANGAIPSSVNVPLDQLESALKMSAEEFKATYSAPKPATADHVVTYCLRGMRAEKAAAALQTGGYTNVDVYPGSWAEWSEHEKQSHAVWWTMFRPVHHLRRYVSIDQVTSIVKAKQCGSEAVRNIQLVDVRSTAEVAATGRIPSAINVPLPVLRDALSHEGPMEDSDFAEFFGAPRPVPRVTQLVFYCAHGVRSEVACEVAEELGFENAGNFSGSWAQWHYEHSPRDSSVAAPPRFPSQTTPS